MSSRGNRGRETSPLEASKRFYRSATEVILTGVAVIIPLVVTAYVLTILLSFVRGALQPVVDLLEMSGIVSYIEQVGLVLFLVDIGIYENVFGFVSELIAIVVLVGLVVAVGLVASHPIGERIVSFFDFFIASIPGVGTVYKSFRRMGDIMIDDDIDNFQGVKLVELLSDDTYVIGFEVGGSPPEVQGVTADEVVTMFIPFAPNPVTGGFLSYVPESRLIDVDMTVEEGVRNVITSGVAGHEADHEPIDSIDLDIEDVQELVESDVAISEGLLEGGVVDHEDGEEERPDEVERPEDD